MNQKKRRLWALIGVIILLLLFILTIMFLLIGKNEMAFIFIAINGFVAVILYFMIRFDRNARAANEDLTQPKDK